MKIHIPDRPTPCRSGFTLMETLVLMTAIALITTLVVVLLQGVFKLEKASSRSLAWLGGQRDLAEQFRTDVAEAAEAPPRWRKDVAGPDCLILARGADHHIVYRWDEEEERLVRLEVEKDQTHRQELALGGRSVSVAFDRSRVGERLLTLRLFMLRKDGKQPSAEILAALGGDLQ
jgi:hypothetical protein